MLNKILLLTPVIIISASMTACSSHKPQKVTSVKTSVIKKAVVQKVKKEVIPVVYEKRTPTVRKSRNNRRIAKRQHYPRIVRSTFANKLSSAALGRLKSKVRYDGSYLKIAYPWGDVPANIGVCTDVVIRSYRKLGIDLQQQVHQDMKLAFNTYPNLKKWGLSRPDTNIDHRRVYNLRQFFARKGAALPITRDPNKYKPGDVVSWMVGPGLPHIGVVVNKRSKADPRRFMIVHNIAHGTQLEDMLFRFPITGHYRYTAVHAKNSPSHTQIASRHKAPRATSQKDMNLLRAAASSLLKTTSKTAKAKTKTISSKNNQKIVLATLNEKAVRELLSQ